MTALGQTKHCERVAQCRRRQNRGRRYRAACVGQAVRGHLCASVG